MQAGAFMTEVGHRTPQCLLQFVARSTAHLPHGHLRELAPHYLDRVQVRCLPGQPRSVQPLRGTARSKVLAAAAPLDRRTIPHHSQRTRTMLDQLLQQAHHGVTALRAPVHAHQHLTRGAQRTDRR